mmetsp:Transcript_6152/g.16909  ORF Transcript_6152/g.16909 Transcript_6152/m.16909 type:complete len:255 (+) Transcript_6152:14-778(+)
MGVAEICPLAGGAAAVLGDGPLSGRAPLHNAPARIPPAATRMGHLRALRGRRGAGCARAGPPAHVRGAHIPEFAEDKVRHKAPPRGGPRCWAQAAVTRPRRRNSAWGRPAARASALDRKARRMNFGGRDFFHLSPSCGTWQCRHWAPSTQKPWAKKTQGLHMPKPCSALPTEGKPAKASAEAGPHPSSSSCQPAAAMGHMGQSPAPTCWSGAKASASAWLCHHAPGAGETGLTGHGNSRHESLTSPSSSESSVE